ncbi:MAG TPA: Ig-like domain-containing protein [Gemmatimonadales bacterium]
MINRPVGIAVGRLFTGVFLTAAAACGGSDLILPGPGSNASAAADIEIVKGNGQSGAAGTMLPDSIVVKVTDGTGTPLPGQIVEFSPTAAGSEVTPSAATTDANGIAGARWVLGSTRGTQIVIARVAGSTDVQTAFEASAGSASARRITAVGGDDQTGAVGTALAAPLVVLVTDEFGNPVEGVSVRWSATGGAVSPRSSRTGADGLAETTWVLGSSIGTQTATASSDELDGSPVAFTATAQPGSANGLVRVRGNAQSGEPGEELEDPLVVRLVDRQGNGVAGQPVTWVVGVGGGSVASTTTITDGNGEAETRWTLGPNPGVNTLNAVVSGVGVVGFTATAAGGGGGGGGGSTPSHMRFVVQPTDVAHKHGIISPPVVVEVLDASGNRVIDREITIRLDLIEIRTGRSKGHETAETQSGVATYPDLQINVVGEFLLRATAPGLPAVDSEPFVTHE